MNLFFAERRDLLRSVDLYLNCLTTLQWYHEAYDFIVDSDEICWLKMLIFFIFKAFIN